MADIIQAQIIDEEIVTPSADPVAHNMPGGGAVESVNGRTGAVVLTADDVGAVAAETFNTAMQGKQDKLTAGDGAEIKDGVLSATSLGITGAAVGQIGRITAVDSDGKPTAWEPVDMPSGGGGDVWEEIITVTIEEDVSELIISQDKNGNPFSLKKLFVIFNPAYNADKQTSPRLRLVSNAGVHDVDMNSTRTMSALMYIDEVQVIASSHYDNNTGYFDTYAIKTHQLSRIHMGGYIDNLKFTYSTYYADSKFTIWGVRA